MTNSNGNSDTVLCVGSDALALFFRGKLLKDHGYSVLTAGNGHDGLHLFAEHSVDAVVLDFDLHPLPGPQVAAEVKRMRPHIPTILLHSDGVLPHPIFESVDAVVPTLSEGDLLLPALQELLRSDGNGRNHSSTHSAAQE